MAREQTRPLSFGLDPLWRACFSWLRRRCRDDDTAADLFQEAYARALKWSQDNAPPIPEAYVWAIVRNLFFDSWRERARSREVLLDEASASTEPEAPAVAPDEALYERRWRVAVRDALEAATESGILRTLLRNWDASGEELAALVGISEVAVRTYRHRLRLRLRRNTTLRRLYEQAPG